MERMTSLMNTFSEALNHPADAFHHTRANAWTSWLPVALTIFIITAFDRIYSHFQALNHPSVSIATILKLAAYGFVSYLIICAVFWIVCKCFGSKATLGTHLNTWGITFFPNILCSLAVVFSEVHFTVFWNNSLWGMLLGIVFVGILVWKVLLYYLYLKEAAELTRGRLIGAFVVIGLFIAVLAALNGYVGLKTPVL